jgi:HDOD domain
VSIREAVELLGAGAVQDLGARVDVFHFFERTPMWNGAPERFRLYAVAVQRAADRIAREIDHPDRDELLVAALLSSCSSTRIPPTRGAFTATLARPTLVSAPSGAPWESTTRWSAASWRGAGKCRHGWLPRSSATMPRRRRTTAR